MKALIIKDLARTEELGRTEMAAVRGGMKTSMPSYPVGTYSPKFDSSIHASQDLMQAQQVTNATANGSAFLDCLHVTNNTDQFGQNNIQVG
jgi:hypothetical protein